MDYIAQRKALENHLSLLMLDKANMARWTEQAKLSHGGARLLSDWMVSTYGAICAWCGNAQEANDLLRGHIIPASYSTPGARGKRRGGVMPGNIALTCKSCNDTLGESSDDVWTMARPDLVPLAWPGMKVTTDASGKRITVYK